MAGCHILVRSTADTAQGGGGGQVLSCAGETTNAATVRGLWFWEGVPGLWVEEWGSKSANLPGSEPPTIVAKRSPTKTDQPVD
jgi:hypothetical protein